MAIYDLIQNYNKLTIKTFKHVNKNTVIIMNFMSQFTLFFKELPNVYIYIYIYIYIYMCVCVAKMGFTGKSVNIKLYYVY